MSCGFAVEETPLDLNSTTSIVSSNAPKGSIVGEFSAGGDSSMVASDLTSGVSEVFSTDRAFAALKSDGSVVTWGGASAGGNSSSVSIQLASGVSSISPTHNSFAALKNDGSVTTWGASFSGGDSGSVSAQISSGVQDIIATESGFLALRNNQVIAVWGNAGYHSGFKALDFSQFNIHKSRDLVYILSK